MGPPDLKKSAPPWSDASYWQTRFFALDTPWELGYPSTVICEALDNLEKLSFSMKGCTALSPGCGRGSDALELLRRGAKVIAIDWSDAALGELTLKAKSIHVHEGLTTICTDFFRVTPSKADLILEHTFFCAIDPTQRARYISQICGWLRPGGFLVGNFFILPEAEVQLLPGESLHGEAGGPPFVSTKREITELFSPHFTIHQLKASTHPDPSRKPGMEWVGIFERRA